ncbi:MAG TPA: cobalamin-dependent protein [Pseudonocardiaceae bacterium]
MSAPRTVPRATSATVVVSSTASDSHTWNLVYLQLLIQELGHTVHNLGACVPPDLLVAECTRLTPDLVVISSVNGHGWADGLRLAPRLRAVPGLSGTGLVIGGKLGTDGRRSVGWRQRMLTAGFDRVFDDGDIVAFIAFVAERVGRVAS